MQIFLQHTSPYLQYLQYLHYLGTCGCDHVAHFAAESPELEAAGQREVAGQLHGVVLPNVLHIRLRPTV